MWECACCLCALLPRPWLQEEEENRNLPQGTSTQWLSQSPFYFKKRIGQKNRLNTTNSTCFFFLNPPFLPPPKKGGRGPCEQPANLRHRTPKKPPPPPPPPTHPQQRSPATETKITAFLHHRISQKKGGGRREKNTQQFRSANVG